MSNTEPTTPLKRRALDKESVPTTRSAAPVSSRATRQATSSSRSPQQLQQQQQHVSPTIPDGRKSIGRLRQQQQQQQQQQVSPTIPGGRKAGGQLPPPQQQQQQHVSPKVDRELAGLLGGMEGISPGVEFGRRRGVRHAHGAQKVSSVRPRLGIDAWMHAPSFLDACAFDAPKRAAQGGLPELPTPNQISLIPAGKVPTEASVLEPTSRAAQLHGCIIQQAHLSLCCSKAFVLPTACPPPLTFPL
eukprot:1137139-Pelagomonas_calceolata.AAC.7